MKKRSYSLEEYKMFYESTEKVTDRRITMNKYNYTACGTILGAIAIIFQWSIDNTAYQSYGTIFTGIFS